MRLLLSDPAPDACILPAFPLYPASFHMRGSALPRLERGNIGSVGPVRPDSLVVLPPQRFNRKKELQCHGAARILYAWSAGSRRSLRSPDTPLEPEDGPLPLWRP